MAYTSINKPSDYFNTVTYTGDDVSPRTVTGVNFQPDFTWIKRRDNSGANHILYDSVRGAGSTKELLSNSTTYEGGGLASAYGYLSAFASDGFTLTDGTDGASEDLYTNQSGATFVSWNWLASNTTASNTDGSITSTVSANTTAGFSIVSFTGTGANATVGHGLSQAPQIYIVKNRASGSDWRVAQTITPTNNMTSGNGYYMELNATKASTNPGSASQWGNPPTAPTSTVVSVGNTSPVNGSGNAMIIYCFHSVKGFSKFGSYTGNGSAEGPFVYTGFKPTWLMVKRSDAPEYWNILDTARADVPNANPTDQALYANDSSVEYSETQGIDLVSNGFKVREGGAGWCNASGGTYIYMAFAESPFTTSTGIPTTAR